MSARPSRDPEKEPQCRDALVEGRNAGHHWLPDEVDNDATFCELLSRRLIEQGLSRPFIELSCNGTELSLAVQGQIGAAWKILTQQPVSVFV